MDAVFPVSHLSPRPNPTSIVVSPPHYPSHHRRQSSRMFFLPLSRGNRDDDDEDKNENEDEDEDEANGRIGGLVAETEEEQEWRKTVAAEGSGRMVEADVPRGKGMQDIAAPRDTRGRNLHDEAGDVLQSYSPPTTKSRGFNV